MGNTISWKAFEYKQKEKTADWYWAVIIIALSIVVISFMLHDGLFAILMIIGVTILLFFSSKEPRVIEISIDPRGIVVGKDKYPFATLEDFWVDISDDENHKILLRSKKHMIPLIVVPLEEYHHLDVRDVLLQYLPEKEIQEPVSRKIMEKLGF
ncbi:MAG: hypothetical protein WCX27_01310 [Candidatus Paceibacterota bacterium]|jgi:sterol desaturase/sphingolipid hydroxylase (fatty acid hydroxylase superfamily)